MKKIKVITSIFTTIAIIGLMNSVPINAKTKYNEIKDAKKISYGLNDRIGKYEIGDVECLFYVSDTGRASYIGDTDLLTDVDDSKLDTLYYIDKNGQQIVIENVNYIDYLKNGREYGTGNGPGNKGANIIKSDKNSLDMNDNTEVKSKKNTGWIKEGTDWKYIDEDEKKHVGWLKEDNEWYYLNDGGNLLKDGILKVNGKTYLLDCDGRLLDDDKLMEYKKKPGWFKDGYMDGSAAIREDWKYIYSNGENCVGWLEDGGYWYYFEKCGHMVKNQMRKINGKVYSFDVNGHIRYNINETIWHTETPINHTGPNEICPFLCATTGLDIVSDGNGVCTLSSNYYNNIYNVLCRDQYHYTSEDNVHHILYDRNGDAVTGWYSEPVCTWPANSSDYLLDKKWTYYDENGVKVKSTSRIIDGKSYSFDKDGYLI
ncbi:hypothetical protein [Clostridium botulinum]|uniref:hypothetical protein n=1 Tax=Clostridium botulinum TaxID=1491 RepID=UPI0007744D91|nr:hypothetical protein [Clostridium botulinum]NFL38719.1 hypothetical protein [Clostridium botulinum]NFN09689.1 hypothetical protein [Clostridium botulinum]NFN24540.1 hypothetical protein [Clostridium botulinum]NFN31811.1 hypothetical protein [Clostridium botulinum]